MFFFFFFFFEERRMFAMVLFFFGLWGGLFFDISHERPLLSFYSSFRVYRTCLLTYFLIIIFDLDTHWWPLRNGYLLLSFLSRIDKIEYLKLLCFLSFFTFDSGGGFNLIFFFRWVIETSRENDLGVNRLNISRLILAAAHSRVYVYIVRGVIFSA